MVGENGLSENQFNFRKGRCTIDTIQAVVDIAIKARRGTGKRKGFCALINIDIRNAFNTARWNICIEAMVRKKVPDYLLRMIDAYLRDRWVIYEGDKWSLKKEMTCDASQGSRVRPLVWNVMTISCTWTYLLERVSSALRMTFLSCAPLTMSESWSWGSMKVCGGQNVGWIADAWKWPLKRPRLCSSRTGDPSNTRRSFSGNMKLSGKRALSTWVCSWIEGIASANTCRSRLPKPSNVEPLWLGSCLTLVAPVKLREGWWRAW